MAKAGRKPAAVPAREWKVYIPSDLAAQVELLLLDPVRNAPKHGARNQLIVSLLSNWLETMRRQP